MNLSPDAATGSPDRFGYSWDAFSDLSPEQEEQFRRWTCLLNPATDWTEKKFLDVGCGAGRNSVWAMKFGATGGMAIDVDDRSLASARRNLAPFSSVEVAFKSIYELDRPEEFDIAFSIGVIHHLAEPELAIQKMRDAVKPGGCVLIWVYGRENMGLYLAILNPLRQAIFSWLPMPLLRIFAYAPASLLWLLLRIGLRRLEYFKLLRNFPFRHLLHIMLDQMLPKIANYWRRDEVRALMEQAGLTDIKLADVNEMSWCAVGVKFGESFPTIATEN
ncbi:MAG: class I SAM-dependent methyltransferase [Rhodospirillales bacterium]|nr:class I SAM-dependent methyltransferase [Rhodospirillales bacterium]